MNEFLEQFVIESRELVEQATTQLSSLERMSENSESVDALFRAFHTLKGGASIVEFAEMEHIVHAAESALTEVRSGKHPFTNELVDHCLACLDQVVTWIEDIERTGDLPRETAEQAKAILQRFEALAQVQQDAGTFERAATARWLERLLQQDPSNKLRAKTAIRFAPRPDSFYRGDDPLELIASLPGLLSLDIEPLGTWPTLNELDPFTCIVVLTALTSSTSSEARTHLEKHIGECEIVRLAIDDSSDANALPARGRSILEAQAALLAGDESQTLVGRVASAGTVAENVLRYCGRGDDADRTAQATEKSLAENDARFLKEQLSALFATAPVVAGAADPAFSPESSPRTFRVDAERVDGLVRLAGELIVVKNAIGHAAKIAQAGEGSFAALLKNHYDALGHLADDLQRAVVGMRVLALRIVLQRFPRVVRELSANLGKPVKCIIEGDETEADKGIIEMLFEPLLHVVRNSIDHGVERSEIRARANKPAVATILMRASRHGDRILIEVSDDGGGVDVSRVREVAVERGVVTSDRLAEMPESEIVDLIFAPGFSTSSKVTELSGRGVGLDAVRTAVARVGGSVSIESRRGEGATVRFALPFSVMMTHVLTVEAGGQMFGIPLDAVVETMRVSVDAIAGVGAAKAMVHRDRALPIFELATILRVQEKNRETQETVIVVASFGGQLNGIRVDRIGERMEVMLKPLEGWLSGIPGMIGTTLLGDGRVLLVLDLEGALL